MDGVINVQVLRPDNISATTTGAPQMDATIQNRILNAGGNVNDVQVNGASVVVNKVAYVIVPTRTSQLTNDSGFITSSALTLYATKSWVEAKQYLTANALVPYSTTAQMNSAIQAHHDSTKQNTISDLSTIRSGAQAGATAVQPSAISDMATKTWVGTYHDSTKQDLLTAGDNITITNNVISATGGGTSAVDDVKVNGTSVVSNKVALVDVPVVMSDLLNDVGYVDRTYHDPTKQDTINDLSTIRAGASSGATAVQPAAISDMATKTWVGTQHDSTKYDASNPSGYINQDALQPYATKQWVEDKDYIEDVTLNGTSVVSSGTAVLTTIDNLTSAGEQKPLTANQGKILNDRINNLEAIGRYLALWDCSTGKPTTDPPSLPYTYKRGDYYRISMIDVVNYMPSGATYTGAASTTQTTELVEIGDFWFYDGTTWTLQINHIGGTITDVQKNGTSVVSGGVANVTVPTTTNELTNNSGFITINHNHDSRYYTESEIDTALLGKVDKVSGKGLSTNDYDATEKAHVASAYGSAHSHSNKQLLDTYDQTNANITTAVANTHSHSNITVLNTITSTIVSGWDSAVTWIATNGANLISHLSDTISHITSTERSTWNSKVSTVKVNNVSVMTGTDANVLLKTINQTAIEGTGNISIPKGDTGDRGPSAVVISTTQPTDPEVEIWLNPDGDEFGGGDKASFGTDDILQFEPGTNTVVEANPTTTTDTLSSIKIGDTSYAIGGGSSSIYLHNIKILKRLSSDYTEVYVNMYTHSATPYDWNTFWSLVRTNELYLTVSGRYGISDFYALCIFSANAGGFYVYRNGSANSISLAQASCTFTDKVVEL